MSFLDQLAKNLNTQTEFFTKLSNISKDSRINSATRPELKLKQKAQVTDNSTEPKLRERENIEVKEKEDFEVKEKEGFFTTAKKVFKEYKVKTDKKTTDKKEPNLKEELETADQALDLIFGLVDPKLQTQVELQQAEAPKPDLSVALEALEIKSTAQDPDPELLDFFLDRIDLRLNSEIETLTKEIVNLDLNTEEGVSEILAISNDIEGLQNIEESIKGIKAELKALINTEALTVKDKELKPELELLLETKIDTKLNELKQAETKDLNLELKPELTKGDDTVKLESMVQLDEVIKLDLNKKVNPKKLENLDLKKAQITLEEGETQEKSIKKVLDEVKATLKHEKAVKDTSIKKPEANLNTFDVKVLQETEAKTQTSKTLDYAKAQVEVIESTETSNSDSDAKQDFTGEDNFETLFPREIKVSNVRVKALSKPVAIKQLPEVITKEAQNVKPGAKQEVKMILDPDNLGKMQLSLTREDNQIHISMVVRTDEAQTKLEQKINDIRTVLKDKGFEANIEVTKSDTNNSNLSQQNQGNTSQGNEAKEEQKEKYLNQVPEWIAKDVEKLDFTEALNRAL